MHWIIKNWTFKLTDNPDLTFEQNCVMGIIKGYLIAVVTLAVTVGVVVLCI